MQVSTVKQLIINDAIKIGFTVVHRVDSVEIYKGFEDQWGNSVISKGLKIYSNGWAFDMTVDHDIAKGVRSHADMRAILNLRTKTRGCKPSFICPVRRALAVVKQVEVNVCLKRLFVILAVIVRRCVQLRRLKNTALIMLFC